MAMTATSTRSTRRAEGVVAHLNHSTHPPSQTQRATRHHQQPSNSSRPLKRLHEATNLSYDLKPTKKAKFEIEIPSKAQYQARLYPENFVDAPTRPQQQQQQQPHHHRVASTVATATKLPKHDSSRQPGAQPASQPAPPTAPESTTIQAAAPVLPALNKAAPKNNKTSSTAATTNGLTRHREKVVNGIKHELDRLQPSSADIASNSQGRKLRSQEGVRYKSELAAYFPEYDEVIGNVPKEHHVLVLDTPIVVVDTSSSSASLGQPHPAPSTFPVRTYNDDLFTNLNDAQTIDFGFLETQYKNKIFSDPLPDAYYEPIHRKESRNEKITRNAEKGRSQHEKEQVIRLLDGLRGPDWLKTMGVSGITETKKKQFEPARRHFITKCEIVLEKFRKWAAEEKRLKLERDRIKENRASHEAASHKDEEDEEEASEEAEFGDEELSDQEVSGEEEVEDDGDRDERASNRTESDVDASAKQLHEEAMARSRIAAAKSIRRRPVILNQQPPPPPPEFKSFFKKPYQREAALNKTRRRGRSVLAWGHPVPEPEPQDFELPEEYRDEDMMKSRARRLRQAKRSSRNKG